MRWLCRIVRRARYGANWDEYRSLTDEEKRQLRQAVIQRIIDAQSVAATARKMWRHADGSVRVDHMDSRPGDYYGEPEYGGEAGSA